MNKFRIHFMNTIWSDCIILEKDYHFSLIDTASKFYYPDINYYLKKNNVIKIDFILLTHFHSDHYGNILNILNDFEVEKLYLKHYYGIDGQNSSGHDSDNSYWEHELSIYNEIINTCKTKNTQIIYLDELNADSYIINFVDVKLEVVDLKNRLLETYNDQKSEFYQIKRFSENFNSVAIYINYLNHPLFLGADMTDSLTDIIGYGKIAEKEINKLYDKYHINHFDIYKSCHHGGTGTNPYDLLKLINPSYMIITNTDRWLDNYSTIPDMLRINPNCEILKTDYYIYRFTINNNISYRKIRKKSLFLKLKKD